MDHAMEIERPEPKLKRPENAKLVFKGVVFDVYQWQQELFDGSFTTFESLKRADTVTIIPVLQDGRIMMLDEEHPGNQKFTALPGGHVEPGENPLETAKRELLEETGYIAETWELLGAAQLSMKIDWASYMFIARGCKDVNGKNPDPGEKIKLMPMHYDRFIEAVCSPGFRDYEIKLRLAETGFDPAKLAEFKKRILGK